MRCGSGGSRSEGAPGAGPRVRRVIAGASEVEMAGGRRKARPRARRAPKPAPIALEPVELLADDLPPGIDEESSATTPLPATLTVAEAGRLIRSGDGTIRRLIRTTVLAPEKHPAAREDADTDRAGVLPRTPGKPGE